MTNIEKIIRDRELDIPYPFANIFTLMNSVPLPKFLSDSAAVVSNLEQTGLKSYLKKPHNLYIKRDEKGNLTKYILKVVYTPFPKNEVHVTVNENVLNIAIGKENLKEEDGCVFHNISGQCENSNIYLYDSRIDFDHITAKCDEGILTIEIPVVEKAPKKIEIV